MKNKTICLAILLFYRFLFSFSVPAEKATFTTAVTNYILNCEFESATKLADSCIAVDPIDPLAPVLKLAALGMRDVDLEMTVDSLLFVNTYKSANDKVIAYEKKYGISSYSQTIGGFTKAIHSSFFLQRKMYMSALQNGMDAIRMLRNAKALDSTNTDADFFLGLYDYAKSELKSRLWWVLFWYSGGKQEGILKLIQCTKTGCITNNAAKLSLSDIYVSEKTPDRSVPLLKDLSDHYPESRFVFWSQAKYFESKKMYSETAVLYEKLATSYASITNGSFNSLTTRYKAAEMYFKAGKKEKAVTICKLILSDPNLKKGLKKDTQKLLEHIDESKS